MAENEVRFRLLVGCERADIDADRPLRPFIAGGVNDSVWENDPDSSDEELARLKASFDPDGSIEWREVWAHFDADNLADVFAVTSVDGRLVADG